MQYPSVRCPSRLLGRGDVGEGPPRDGMGDEEAARSSTTSSASSTDASQWTTSARWRRVRSFASSSAMRFSPRSNRTGTRDARSGRASGGIGSPYRGSVDGESSREPGDPPGRRPAARATRSAWRSSLARRPALRRTASAAGLTSSRLSAVLGRLHVGILACPGGRPPRYADPATNADVPHRVSLVRLRAPHRQRKVQVRRRRG